MKSPLKNALAAMLLLGIISAWFLSEPAMALRLKYNELQIKNYDEMRKMVNDYIQKSKEVAVEKQEEGDLESGDQLAIDELTKALKLILARPDKDNMASKLMPTVKRELDNYSAYTNTLNAVATEAISALEMKKLPPVYRATAIFILENLMAEVRPKLHRDKTLLGIVRKIDRANIEIGKDVRNHRKLTGMVNTTSPSKTAEKLIDRAKKKRDRKKNGDK